MTDLDRKMTTRVQDLLLEADAPRQRYIERADVNNAQAMGDFGDDNETMYGHSCFIINKTQLSIMAHTQIQMEQDPQIDLTARESGRTTEYWMSERALLTIKSLAEQGHISLEEDSPEAIDPEGEALAAEIAGPTIPVETQGFTFEQLEIKPNQKAFPVTESFLQRVMPLMQPWLSLTGEQMAPVLKMQDIIEISDEIAADVVGNNCAILWDKGDNSKWLFNSIYHTNIVGWDFSLYQWDEEKQCDSVMSIHPRHVWLPPEATSVEDADYAILREPLSKSRAKERYPHLAEKIDHYFPGQDTGDMLPGSMIGVKYPLGGPWMETTFRRNMIDVWTLWERGEKYPMAPDEALDAGKVVQTKDGFFLVEEGEDGEERTTTATNPKAKNWPKKCGVKQTQICAEVVVSDEECPYGDIPLLLNKNVPIPFRWVGQGEPERLYWLDRIIMKLSSAIFDIVKYNRSPQVLMPDDVWEALKDQREQMSASPNRLMHLEATLYEKYQAVLGEGNGFYIKPMTVPETSVELLREMLNLHDVLSANTAEIQGRNSGSDSQSGKAIELLQSAARGLIGFKATSTEAMLVRLTRLRVHAMTKRGWLTPRSWKRFNDKYPVEVLEVVRLRAKEIDLDIKAEVSSGSGELKRVQQQQAREDRTNGFISLDTLLSKLEYDAEEEIAKLQQEQAAMQPQQAAVAA